jgi:hypothetical protein
MAQAQRLLVDKFTLLERYIAIRAPIPEKLRAEIDDIGIEKTLRRCTEAMKSACSAAKSEHLSHPLGIALACEIIGRPEYEAGIEYALLYRQVYGRLRADVEAAFTAELGPEALALALGVGRTSGPQPPTSMFRELIGGAETPPFVKLTPEESEKQRRALGKRWARAYAVLKADFWVHSVIDGALVAGHKAKYLYAGPPLTPDHHMRRKAFQAGLERLSAHFGYDRADRGKGSPAANGAAPPRQRRRGSM